MSSTKCCCRLIDQDRTNTTIVRQLLISGLWLWSVTCAAATLTVCPACPLGSITAAIAQASAGDTIIVQAGTYREGNIVIDKPVTLIGDGFPVLDGLGDTEVLTIVAHDVTVRGLQVQNVGTSYLEDRAGIRVRRSKRFAIIGNRLENTFFGIYLEHASDGEVRDNAVRGLAVNEMSSGNAIHLWYCKNVRVIDNEVSGHRDGIYFEFVDNSFISGNVSADNLRYGLHFMFSNDDVYVDNTFRRNGAGVAVMFSREIDMYDNIFEYNWGKSSYGLLLKEIYDAEIERNVFHGNSIGILVEGSTRINYRHNEFSRNGWAIKISGGCLDNVVTNNNFVTNTFDLSISSNVNNNSFDGNYWSAYHGYDLDRDGIGDVPYRPVKLFNFIVNRTPEAIVLLRSLFIDLVNFSEKVSPVFTPKNVVDARPHLTPFETRKTTGD